jgi:hypothetical protein
MSFPWWVFVHLVGVFGFLLSHGVSTGVALRLRRERDRARIQVLLQLSTSTITTFYTSSVVLLVGGIGAGFKAAFWSQGWIWTSLGLFAALTIAMLAIARPHYRKVGRAVQMRASGNPAVSDVELDALLRSATGVAVLVIGFVGLGAILYLMVLKPF